MSDLFSFSSTKNGPSVSWGRTTQLGTGVLAIGLLERFVDGVGLCVVVAPGVFLPEQAAITAAEAPASATLRRCRRDIIATRVNHTHVRIRCEAPTWWLW